MKIEIEIKNGKREEFEIVARGKEPKALVQTDHRAKKGEGAVVVQEKEGDVWKGWRLYVGLAEMMSSIHWIISSPVGAAR